MFFKYLFPIKLYKQTIKILPSLIIAMKIALNKRALIFVICMIVRQFIATTVIFGGSILSGKSSSPIQKKKIQRPQECHSSSTECTWVVSCGPRYWPQVTLGCTRVTLLLFFKSTRTVDAVLARREKLHPRRIVDAKTCIFEELSRHNMF